jgi:hypothetical protein
MGDHHELHYGFFGLTALGPTSTFAQGAMLAVGVSEFSDDEWEAGFNKFDADKSGQLDPNELYNLLYHVYHGPPPKFASEGFISRFDKNRDGKISKDEFMAAMQDIKRQEAETIKLGGEHPATPSMYNSYSEYQSRVKSHKLLDVVPKEKYHAPMTTNMAVGWADVDYNQVLDDILPKKSCAETLYADAMVKAGKNFLCTSGCFFLPSIHFSIGGTNMII